MMPVVECPDPISLGDLLDGMLSDREQEGLTRHLDECPHCQQRLEMLATGGDMPTGIARLGRRREAGPGLARAINALTTTAALDTPLPTEELILDFLKPSDRHDVLGEFGPYDVLRVLGHGGMGIVLEARDTGLNRVVAIKVLAPQLAASASARKRFAREARAVAAVEHPNVVAIHAVEVRNGLPYLVMEHVPGESLQQRLDRDGPLPLETILSVAVQIAEGLAAAHQCGIVHRDLKPGNILLTGEDVRITDFGLARTLDDGGVTQSGFLPGTPAYMAPEQARGDGADHRSDLFSLGSVMYAMATARPPFRASTLFALLHRVSEDRPVPVQDINPHIPDWLVFIKNKLHAKDPEQRFQSAGEVAGLLRECLDHVRQPTKKPLPWSLRQYTKPRPSSKRASLVAAVLLLTVLGVGFLAASVFRVKTPEGTLVVEADDPTIQVTVDGKDVLISGQGIAEVRLRAGQYKLEASKDGKPMMTKLLDIRKGGKEVVKVMLEPPDAAATMVPTILTRVPMTLRGHKGELKSLTYSPNGKVLVSVGNDDGIRFWDAISGKQLVEKKEMGNVLAITFFPDGKILVTISSNGTVQLWEVATGKLLSSVKLPGTIKLSALDPSGKLFVGGNDRNLRVWDVETGKEHSHIRSVEDISGVTFSPEGNRLAIIDTAGVTLWDVKADKVVLRLRDLVKEPRSALFSPDGKRIVVVGDAVRIWDAVDGKDLRHIRERPVCVAQSPDGKYLATGNEDGGVKVMSATSGEVMVSHKEKAGPISAIAFSPDGKSVAWGVPGGDIRIAAIVPAKTATDPFGGREPTTDELKEFIKRLMLDLEVSQNEADRQKAQAEVERARAILERQRAEEAARREAEQREQAQRENERAQHYLYANHLKLAQQAWADGDPKKSVDLLNESTKGLRQWEWDYLRKLTRTGKPSRLLEGHRDGVRAVTFTPDGKRIASTSYDFTARIWDVATGKTIVLLDPHDETVDAIVISPGGAVVTASRAGMFHVWDIATGKARLVSDQGEKGPASLAISPDGKYLAWGAKSTLSLIDLTSGKLLQKTQEKDGTIRSVAYSPDGKTLAYSGDDLFPRLIEVPTGKRISVFTGDDKEYAPYIAFSPDGRHLAAATQKSGSIWLIDVATSKVVRTMRGHAGAVNAVAFSPDGQRLASGGEDRTVKLWDVSSGIPVLTLTGHEKGVTSIAFSPDGKQIVTGGLDKTIRLWDGP